MHPLAKLDHRHLWHPFTQMRDWLKQEPIVITGGKGALLRDARGREYLDGNSSIWTNLHGHSHPQLNRAIAAQLGKIAHSSALGFANEPASLLGQRLVDAANPPKLNHALKLRLPKVFYSDDGSTAMEVALKLGYEYTRRARKNPRPKFLSLDGAYHGDTVGAVSAGHIDLFHKAYAGLLFKTDKLRAPYCYRCPHNRAKPERADAREYRRCNSECLQTAERVFSAQKRRGKPYAGFIFEPLMQGAAGMIAQPKGWLRQVATLARDHGALLIADEVMTAFGRAGGPSLFASHREGVQPDLLSFAKGLTGGYLPMAATLTTQAVFDAFLGEYEEFKTFFHGHSFTGNQLGAAAALASLDILQSKACVAARKTLEETLRASLETLWQYPHVGDIRREGTVAGIELVKNWRTREPYALRERVGIRVCDAMAKRGVLTRPVGSVIVVMPPYCTTPAQARRFIRILGESIGEITGKSTAKGRESAKFK
jgi:adenosylmethionine-8-amino-7-oxononanoate aminotransferase